MKLDKKLTIAIDGPAGAGKSTVAKIVAERLNYLYIDTGAMYRALTLKALQQGVDLNDDNQLGELAQRTRIRLKRVDEKDIVLLDNIDVNEEIRDNKVSNNVSVVAKVRAVREQMVRLQREMAREGQVVMDGRDIGTVVLPDAHLKVFLTASVEERAKRRYEELKSKGEDIKLDQIKEEIIRRDNIDKNREISPLMEAEDAIKVDTTNLDIEGVVKHILDLCQEV
ncbi:(d)CMP kinase [Halonatronum saccharophilum]|uniref:(d)CMP kinase n=1 Tax=Halonatronum saccharophilum TaxID=150060 RepID=UPI00048867FE|nr:(d)CMP kinase [Halonatronum saccharophilum]